MEYPRDPVNLDHHEKDHVYSQNLSQISDSHVGGLINGTKCIISNDTTESGYPDKEEFIVEVVLLTVIGVFGITGNTAAIVVFSRMKTQMIFHRIMIMLSTFDNILVLLNIVIFVYPRFSESFNATGYHYIAPYTLPVAQIAMTGSVYSTMAITVERYLIACKPFYVISHRWSAKRYIVPIVVFSISYNLPKFFETKTTALVDETDMNKTSFAIEATDLRLNKGYYNIYTIWMNFIFMGVLPFLLLMVLNILTLKSVVKQIRHMGKAPSVLQSNIQRSNNIKRQLLLNNRKKFNKRRKSETTTTNEEQLAKISLTIVLVSLICHGVRWVPNIYELVQISDPDFEEDCFIWPAWIERVSNISHLLITLNASVNFYIYYAKHMKSVSKCILYKGTENPQVKTGIQE